MSLRRHLLATALALAVALPGAQSLASPFTFQGFLEQSGTPINGSANLAFRLFDAASGGNQLGSTVNANAYPVLDGVFTIDLNFAGVAFADANRWLQVDVNGTPMGPRIEVLPAPLASSTRGLQGRTVSAAAPSNGQVLKWNGSVWAPAADNGGITYEAGAGLSLTGNTFAVDFGGSGASSLVARSDHSHYGSSWSGSAAQQALAISQANATAGATALFAISSAPTGVTLGVAGVSNSTSATARGVLGHATASSGDVWGVQGRSDSSSGRGVYGLATAGSGQAVGVWGATSSSEGRALYGEAVATSGSNFGVYGRTASTGGVGVRGDAVAASGGTIGVLGSSTSNAGTGVRGEGRFGVVADGSEIGVDAAATTPTGQSIGVRGASASPDGAGVFAINSAVSGDAFGAYAQSSSSGGTALVGDALATSGSNRGVLARSASGGGVGLRAENVSNAGLATALQAIGGSNGGTTSVFEANGGGSSWAIDAASAGPTGRALNARLTNAGATGAAVYAQVNAAGARAVQGVNLAGGLAGDFSGNVAVSGTLSKGGGSFKIDHPLDPANRYLLHSFVESPDMMNIYNGNVVTDGQGYARIELPDWFEVLNRDFRYQLTVIGSFARAMVAEEVDQNHFAIRTDEPNIRVSWQVTGIRQDAWAEHNRIPVELDKAPEERGKFLHPEALGQPAAKRIDNGRTDKE